jgi:hypothetical protein
LNVLNRVRFQHEKQIKLDLISSCVKDSIMLLNVAKDINLSPGAEFFTADASYMYANIVIYTGLQIFQNHFNDCNEKQPSLNNFSSKKIKLVMKTLH